MLKIKQESWSPANEFHTRGVYRPCDGDNDTSHIVKINNKAMCPSLFNSGGKETENRSILVNCMEWINTAFSGIYRINKHFLHKNVFFLNCGFVSLLLVIWKESFMFLTCLHYLTRWYENINIRIVFLHSSMYEDFVIFVAELNLPWNVKLNQCPLNNVAD